MESIYVLNSFMNCIESGDIIIYMLNGWSIL